MMRLFHLLIPVFVYLVAGASLAAQDIPKYRLTTHYGLAGLTGERALNQGFAAGLSLDKFYPLGPKNTLFAGAGLQHANYENGNIGQPCDFPLGDKVVVFNFSETYEFNPLEASLRLGAEQRFGRFSVRGVLLPTLRLRDRITANSNVDFAQPFRPNQTASTKVRPNESFLWTDNTIRELRYNTPARLQVALEVNVAISERFTLGLGYQTGLTKYEIDNYLVRNEMMPPCGIVGCPEPEEFVVSSINARTGRGYLALQVNW